MKRRTWQILILAGIVLSLAGCGFAGFSRALTGAVLNQTDVETARRALPGYLVMNDALIERSPEDGDLLQSGAILYGFYASALVEEPQRVPVLAARARDYGERALCAEDRRFCGLSGQAFAQCEAALDDLDEDALPALYAGALSWLVSIKASSGDWAALADLPKAELLLQRMLAVDEGYEHGSLHCYLGILKTLRPAAMGGDPEAGRRHFERAIELSGGRDLSFKVEYAASYARAVYDRDLHDRLLQEVLQADARVQGLTLINLLAQERAKVLLDGASDYF